MELAPSCSSRSVKRARIGPNQHPECFHYLLGSCKLRPRCLNSTFWQVRSLWSNEWCPGVSAGIFLVFPPLHHYSLAPQSWVLAAGFRRDYLYWNLPWRSQGVNLSLVGAPSGAQSRLGPQGFCFEEMAFALLLGGRFHFDSGPG